MSLCRLFSAFAWLLLSAAALHSQSSRPSTVLALTVAPECSIESQPASAFDSAQVLTFRYKIRTAATDGQGRIVLRLASSGDYPGEAKVEFQTQAGSPATPLANSRSLAEAVQTGIVIATFGPQASSAKQGTPGSVHIRVVGVPAGSLQPSVSISCR
ncbi:MAG: hypothetical protein HY820_27900 [Acidobacteria bacterium]|nr:hypothetical protein [Acidobacteriota bacterium]